MRDIRFRGKRVDNGEWVYGYVVFSQDNLNAWISESKEDDWTVKGQSEVIPESVGQFTGLYSKSGQEIYEGDICSTDLSRPYLIVVFRNGAFMYQCHDEGKDYFDIMLPTEVESDVDKYTEVIGNIYDNPEHLEVQPWPT